MDLIYIEKTKEKYRDGTYLSKYKCYCGKEFLALDRSIRSKRLKSCGCMRGSTAAMRARCRTPGNALKDPTESSLNSVYINYYHSAKNKKLEFKISKEFFRNITQQHCFYCGEPPSNKCKYSKWARSAYIYNGIDRVNSSVGYIESNCVPCCKKCNYLKSNRSQEDFIKHLRRIVEWIKKLSI